MKTGIKTYKKVDYSILSDKKCKCGKRLKKNVTMRNEQAKYCYVCFKILKGKETPELLKKYWSNIRQYKGINHLNKKR